MGPKKATPAEAGKSTRQKISLEMKKEIIRKHDGGMRVIDLAREYGRNPSTIGTILKDREKILGKDAAKGVTRIAPNRPPVLEEVERLLILWMEEKQRAGDTVTEAVICEKARALHADLSREQPGTSTEAEPFKASRGWFERFKTRSGIHSVVRHGEAASSDVPAAEDFATEFLEVMSTEGYLPEQVFNCHETGLFWKRMPKRTFVTQEESRLPGHKLMKDRLTLLFCANASGDLKVKPLLVYHSETPRAFRKHKVDKERLGVMWRSNTRAWVTRVLFVDWVNHAFGPAVKQFLLDKDLPLKALLLMDNAPAHPPGLEGDLAEDFRFIRILFLPPNTTPLLQPMDQQVIANFKKLYTRELFRRCFQVTDATNLTLRDFWRDHFDIVGCVKMINTAWAGVSQRTLVAAWQNLWPDCEVRGSPASEPAPEEAVVGDIVSLGRNMGLEVTEEDISELMEDHEQELTTQELVDLQTEAMEEQASAEEAVAAKVAKLPTEDIKDICHQWKNVQTWVQHHHPDRAVACEQARSFDVKVMSSLRGILQGRQKQQTMDRFLTKKPRLETEPAASTSAASTSGVVVLSSSSSSSPSSSS